MEGDGASSHGSSVASSTNDDNNAKKRKDRREAGADGERDLLEDKKSAEEALHASMYALVKEKGSEPWQMTAIKIVMEGLVAVLILFNPQRTYWQIDESQWTWKLVRWAIFRSPIVSLYSYNAYSTILYVLVALTCSVLVGTAFLAWSMQRGDQSKWLKTLAKVLQFTVDILFGVLYMSILDFLLFYFDCSWSSKPITHLYYNTHECFKSPHMMPLILSGIMIVLFTVSTIAVQTASCDLNPCAKGVMASPAAVMKIKVVCAKAVYIASMNVLSFSPKLQALVATVSVLYVFWLNFDTAPFLRAWVNYIWCGMWLAVLYVSCIYLAMAFSSDNKDVDFLERMTMAILYGIWAPLFGGVFITWAWHTHRMRAAGKFRAVEMDRAQLRKVHKFHSPQEVLIISRVMRKFDLDGIIDPQAAAVGEIIIKAGLAHFPNNPMLLILWANFKMEVHQDGPASRTLLQSVAKHQPNFVERYQVFCTVENSKRLKESNEQGMDMHSYVEFKRNYRAVLRAHKEALMQIRDFWTLMMRSELQAERVETEMRECDAMIQRSYRVYRRVVERYPTNGKLLKCYGSFLEDVKNDFKGATRVYAEAVRHGGSGNGLLSMDFDFASQTGKPDMLLSMDVNEDAVVIINAEGIIMMVSQGVSTLFGYSKGELEGQNVSVLMPPPFNQRHNSYMQNYKDTGQVHILDSVKEVVALHKERRVFPVQICVTKLSGIGTDAVFLGLLRSLPFSKRDVRAWLAPNGVILCCGPMFSALTGIIADEMVGTNIKHMLADPEPFEKMVAESMLLPPADVTQDKFKAELVVINKYVGQIPINVFLTVGGTDMNRVLVVHMHRVDDMDENLLVVDEAANVTFATVDLAVTLGYDLKVLLKMNLKQLLPSPTNVCHEKWLRDAPPSAPITSCRSGTVVNMVGANSQLIPVRIRLSQREEPSGLKHVTRICKATGEDMLDDRRVMLTATYEGVIQSVTPENAIFGFPSTMLKGMHVSDVIDIFSDWRERSGSRDMQLLMLALLDKEQEMPGAAWRIKLAHPASLQGDKSDKYQPKSAIFQASPVQTHKSTGPGGAGQQEAAEQVQEDEQPRVLLTLWRRELLVGSMELDPNLRVRRSDQFAGLILGRPPSSIVKKPLQTILEIPRHAKWEDIMAANNKKAKSKGLLKSGAITGKVSSIKAFEGRHPDGGALRILVLGVVITDVNGKARIEVTIKPDMTFAAAHSNIWGALGLDFDQQRVTAVESGAQGSQPVDGDGHSSGGEGEHVPLKASRLSGLKAHSSKKQVVEAPRDSTADSEGDFVKRWVRTVSKQEHLLGPGSQSMPPQGGGGSRKQARDSDAGSDAPVMDWMKEAVDMPDEAFAMARKPKAATPPQARGAGSDDGHSSDGEHSEGSEPASSASGEKADQQSAFTASVTGEEEILVDSRRGKLLHKLLNLLQQPLLTSPIERLKYQTLLLMLALLLMRIVCFFIAQSVVAEQQLHIRQVQDTALASDRSQVMAVRALVAGFCKGLDPAVLAQDNVCNTAYNIKAATTNLKNNIADFDTAAQNVYIGMNSKVKKIPDATTYNVWTQPLLNMTLYLDIQPTPSTVVVRRSLWELSNQFSAAAKEILWLMNYRNSSEILSSPAYKFIEINGPYALFQGFADALDALMVFAWNELGTLNTSIIALLVSEVLVFMPLIILWQWYLISKAERTRLVTWMFMVALPGPVLRTLGSRPIKVHGDSDDGSGSDSDSEAPGAAAHNPSTDGRMAVATTTPTSSAAPMQPGNGSIARPVVTTDMADAFHRSKPKVVHPSYKYVILFLLPLALCFIMLIVVYAITLVKVRTLEEPLAALNMAMHVLYRFSHIRYVAFATTAQTTVAGKVAMLKELGHTLRELDSEYNSLMYGGTAITQQNAMFREPTKAAPFLLASFADFFFKTTRCMRADQSTCYPEGSPWYEATHHGLDSMMQRMIAEMSLMTKDRLEDLVYTNSRYDVMYHVGVSDLYNGLQMAAQLFVDYSIKSYQQINQLQVAMLAVQIVLLLGSAAFILRPYLLMRKTELVEVAGMVSHVPQEVDVTTHVKKVLRQTQKAKAAAKAAKEAGSGVAPSDKDPLLTANNSAPSKSGLIRAVSPKGFSKV